MAVARTQNRVSRGIEWYFCRETARCWKLCVNSVVPNERDARRSADQQHRLDHAPLRDRVIKQRSGHPGGLLCLSADQPLEHAAVYMVAESNTARKVDAKVSLQSVGQYLLLLPTFD